jgi:hypothetical protein
MSAFGRHWSLKIRGCTIAEHALAHRLGDRHNEKTGQCYPGRKSLCFELECSPTYLVQLFQSLQKKRYIGRQSRFGPSKVQTTNQFVLNFDRWFPFHSEEVEREEKRLLGFFRRGVESPELAQGFLQVWIEKPKVPGKIRNEFKQNGVNPRPTKKKPYGKVLWIAVASEAHERHLIENLPNIMKEITADTGHRYAIEILRTWLKKPAPTDLD